MMKDEIGAWAVCGQAPRTKTDAAFSHARRLWHTRGRQLIDDIDRALAEGYDFTDDELRFVIDHDIKCRVGGSDDGNDE